MNQEVFLSILSFNLNSFGAIPNIFAILLLNFCVRNTSGNSFSLLFQNS